MNKSSKSTKEKICRITAQLISKSGVKGASTRNICNALGITAPTLYHYFSDKSALLDAVTELAFQKHILHVTSKKNRHSPIESLKTLWDNYMDFAQAEKDLFVIMTNALTQGKILHITEKCYLQLKEEFLLLDKLKKLKFSPSQSAKMYLSAAQGFALMHVILKSENEYQQISDNLRNITLEGLLVN